MRFEDYGRLVKFNRSDSQGVAVIEVLVGISIVTILTLSIYMSLSGAVRNMGDAKQRTGAIALANEKMEVIRHLDYNNIGTLEGIPNGPLDPDEEVLKNGFNYSVETEIRYIDDPFDQLKPADENEIDTDYKQARVKVFWQNSGQAKYVEFFSNFVPNGVETDMGGGTLSINTTDSGGQIVPNVSINVDSVEDAPSVNVNAQTDDQGNIIFPGTYAQTYRITLSKDGYETAITYPNPPVSPFTPINPDINVTEGGLVSKTFFINKSANLIMNAIDIADDSGIEGIDFSLKGGTQIGFEPDTYLVDNTETTDSSGKVEKNGTGPGIYEITNLAELGNDRYFYLGSDATMPIHLAAEESKVANFIFADKTIDSLAVIVKDAITGLPLSGAQVHVVALDFDHAMTTAAEGIAYFPPQAEIPITMNADEYQVLVEAPGYGSENETVTITSGLEELEISLTEL